LRNRAYTLDQQAVRHGTGIVQVFFIALAMNLASYWFSDKIVLTMYRVPEAALA
jgi:heat shock protein HtpX